MAIHLVVAPKGVTEVLRVVELLVGTGIPWVNVSGTPPRRFYADYCNQGSNKEYLFKGLFLIVEDKRDLFLPWGITPHPHESAKQVGKQWKGSTAIPVEFRGIPLTAQEFEDLVHPNGG
jgi:hypothetical protein